MVTPLFTRLLVILKTIKNVNDLKEGAKIVVPNDPSNRGRALILLEKQGLIKLKNVNDLLSTVADIVEIRKTSKYLK